MMTRVSKRFIDFICNGKSLAGIICLILFSTLIIREIQYGQLIKLQQLQVQCHQNQHTESKWKNEFTQATNNETNIIPHRIALGIFSVHRPNAPDYVYSEVSSILDTLFMNQTYIKVDKIHVFDGSFNGSQVRFFKYSKHIQVHPMNATAFEMVKDYPVHRKASLNYLLTLRYLVNTYDGQVDAFLILEDDVIFDPNASQIIWEALNAAKHQTLFLVDGYVKGPMHSIEEDKAPMFEFKGEARCCSQAFLLSPEVARISIPLIEKSLNGSAVYLPLDVYLSSSLLALPDFHFYFAKKCWVQHVGYPVLGLGVFHRGCSRMTFDQDEGITRMR